MTDFELITRVKDKQDSAALTQLINLHTGIYIDIVRQYSVYPDFTNRVNVADLIENKQSNIYDWMLKFDPTKGMKFGTYVGEMTKYMCKGIIQRGDQSVEFNEEIAPTNDSSITKSAETDSSVEEMMNEIRNSDCPVFKKIMKLKLRGKSWRQIGTIIDMSHEGARKVYEKHIGALKERVRT